MSWNEGIGELGILDAIYLIPRSHSTPQMLQSLSPSLRCYRLWPILFLIALNYLSHTLELVAHNFMGRYQEAER